METVRSAPSRPSTSKPTVPVEVPRAGGLLTRRPEVIVSPLLLVVVLVAWEAAVAVFQIPSFIIPPPSGIAFALYNGFAGSPTSRGAFYIHIGQTSIEMLAGFFVGSGLGLTLGAAFSQFRILERVLLPYILAFQSTPKVAIAPLFVIWLGYGIASKIAVVTLICFFPVLVNTMAGCWSVEQDRIDLMRSLAATRWQIFRKVIFPSSLPFVFAGLEIAALYSLTGAVVGEFVGAQLGLGVLLLQYNFALDVRGVFAILGVLSALGTVMFVVLKTVRRRVLFWAPEERRAAGL